MPDLLILFGGAVKALGAGKVGGHLVVFGSEEQTDKSELKDFFTKSTDYDLEEHASSPVYYQHGLDETLKARKLGSSKLGIDEVGVWIEAQLAMRDDYEKGIYGMAEAKKLSWSSGTAPHLVERKKVGDAHEVIRWPLGLDASLTPTPAEPRASAVAIKSLGQLKAQMLGEQLDARMTLGALSNLYDALMNRIYGALYGYDMKEAGADSNLEQRLDIARACFDEYRDEAIRVMTAIMNEPVDSADAYATKRLQSLLFTSASAALKRANIQTERQFEELLREAGGFSRNGAETVCLKGFKHYLSLGQREAGEQASEIVLPSRAALESQFLRLQGRVLSHSGAQT